MDMAKHRRYINQAIMDGKICEQIECWGLSITWCTHGVYPHTYDKGIPCDLWKHGRLTKLLKGAA